MGGETNPLNKYPLRKLDIGSVDSKGLNERGQMSGVRLQGRAGLRCQQRGFKC